MTFFTSDDVYVRRKSLDSRRNEPVGWVSRAAVVLAVAILSAGACSTSHSQTDSDEPFGNRPIRIIVPFAPGGGYDLHARLLAKHLRNHVPGTPTVTVESMPGAGGLIAAKYFVTQAHPDGLTIGLFSSGLVLHQLVPPKNGWPLDVAVQDFTFVGSPSPERAICFLSSGSGIADIAAWARSSTTPTIGMTGPGSGGFESTQIVIRALDLPMRAVVGYQGTSEIKQAIDSRELDGGCASYESFKTAFGSPDAYTIIIQAGLERIPDLAKVPLALDLARSDEARTSLRALAQMREIGRFYALPPGTPMEIASLVRNAFWQTMHDPEFIASARTASLLIDPMDGHEVRTRVLGLLSLPDTAQDQLAEILGLETS